MMFEYHRVAEPTLEDAEIAARLPYSATHDIVDAEIIGRLLRRPNDGYARAYPDRTVAQ